MYFDGYLIDILYIYVHLNIKSCISHKLHCSSYINKCLKHMQPSIFADNSTFSGNRTSRLKAIFDSDKLYDLRIDTP